MKNKSQTVIIKIAAFFVVTAIAVLSSTAQAVVYDLQIFSSNGNYYDDPGLNLFVEVLEYAGKTDFTFFNQSSILLPRCLITPAFLHPFHQLAE